MSREKFATGERVEMRCNHIRAGMPVNDWLPGLVVQTDHRMLAVKFETTVFTSNGLPAPERVLWCTHGSPNLRRPDQTPMDQVGEGASSP
jgi:hypothetical protein